MIHDQLLAQTSRAIFDKKQINEDPDLRWMAAAALLPSWTSQQKLIQLGMTLKFLDSVKYGKS